ncbi:MAG TPA: alcohol dehydrogenase catalytic domain-containing protein, partial [Phnomibacter sp.]|nr:alcohol dehydrogenase catalytic domain-containing protein [Phnomibacter sp.]
MKAVTRYRYCPPEGLQISELPIPIPKDNELLVRVHATTVNRTDVAIVTGKPWAMRLFTGLTKPSSPIPGTDYAGIVEAVGGKVSQFKPGDRVWGFHDNGLHTQAQYMLIAHDRPM